MKHIVNYIEFTHVWCNIPNPVGFTYRIMYLFDKSYRDDTYVTTFSLC